MRALKKIIAFLITMSMFCGVAFAEENAVAPTEEKIELTARQQEMVKVLSALNIISYYDDKDLRLDDKITRAEAVSVIMKARGFEQSTDDKSNVKKDSEDLFAEYVEEVQKDPKPIAFFQDVTDDYWAAQSIEAATALGIIGGYADGIFAPELATGYEQAVKLVVCLMGYDVIAKEKGGYPTGYFTVAAEKGILHNVNTNGGKEITRGDFFILVYNALSVDMLIQNRFGSSDEYSTKKNRNIMSEYLDVIKETDIVYANEYASIAGGETASRNEVIIGNFKYKVGNTNAASLIGYKVTAYSKYDELQDERTLILISFEENNILTLSSYSITDVEGLQTTTGGVINYSDDNITSKREEKANLSVNAKYIYNNKALPVITDNDLKFSNGSVELIDWEDDGFYDVVIVRSYETYQVDSLSTVTNMVYDKLGKPPIVLDKDDSSIDVTIMKDGAPVEITAIKEWDVLEILKSKTTSDKMRIEAVIVTDVVDGVVDEITQDEIRIKDIYYKTAPNFNMSGIKPSDSGIFYKNISGRIISVKKSAGEEFKYGYIIKSAKETSGVQKAFQFKMAGKNGKAVILKTAKKVTVNGDPKTVPQLEILFSTRGLIQYALNDKNEITKIKTYQVKDNSSYDLENFSRDYVSNGVAYNNFSNRYGEMYSANGNTVVIMIPSEATNVDEKKYLVGTISMLVTNDTLYPNIQIFDANDNYEIGALVITGGDATAGIAGAPTFRIIKSISKCLNEDGEDTLKITYYTALGAEDSAVLVNKEIPMDTSWGVSKTIDKLVPGDIINFTKDSNGLIDKIAVHFDSITLGSTGNSKYIYKNSDKKGATDDIPVHGEVYYTFEKVLKKSAQTIIINGQKSSTEKKQISFSIGSATVLIFDKNRYTLSKGTANDVGVGDEIFLSASWQQAKTVIVYR